MIKKLFVLLVVLALASGWAFADITGSRIGDVKLNSVTVSNTTHVHVSTSPVDVYRVTITAEQTNLYGMLYNSSGSGSYDTIRQYVAAMHDSHLGDNASGETAQNIRIKSEVSCGTATETEVFTFNPPLRFDQGLMVGFAPETNTNALTSQDDTWMTIEYLPVTN